MGMPLQPYSVGPTYFVVWLGVMPYYGLITLRPYSYNLLLSIPKGKLSFPSVLVIPISSALFYPPNPKAISTFSLPTSNITAPYISHYFPSLLQVQKKSESDLFLKVTAKKIGGPATPTPGKSKRPHHFQAGTRALQDIQKYQKTSNLLVPAASFIREVSTLPHLLYVFGAY
ncbi:hypothetical protein Goshw_012110 [Gossypium schwendimanii]|uniref:Histone H2A/H2B/H3 domain-containing protein n=1 Tax=Gossypium schwendimanii TaxID=34291 RepID=A0A7J9KKV0_GOSSC|nr:hypothetical protein [Gossypium schwendimanii]